LGSQVKLGTGEIYTYVGEHKLDPDDTEPPVDLSAEDYTDTGEWQPLNPVEIINGDVVKLDQNIGAAQAGDIYQYVGEDNLGPVDLAVVTYTDGSLWTKLYPVDLGSEDYNNTSWWEKETTIKARSAAASVSAALALPEPHRRFVKRVLPTKFP